MMQFQSLINLNETNRRLYNQTVENLLCTQYKNAIFFAEKLACINDYSGTLLIFLLSYCHFMNQDYQHSSQLLKEHKLTSSNYYFQTFAAKSEFLNKQFEVAINTLD